VSLARSARVRQGVCGVAAAVCVAVAAAAAIPEASKIVQAVADANRVSSRAEPLLIDVVLRIDSGVIAAQGQLATHPSGLARLELKSSAGFVERHLLQGDAYAASRDGVMLPNPHPFLPPVFLLQSTSGAALAAALSSYGVSEQEVVLGRMADHDCYVIGGRLPGRPGEERLLPSFWVDMESFEPLRIVRSDGVEYRLGPVGVFNGIRLPRYIEIVTPDAFRATLEVVRAAPANAPAAAFQRDWLTAPPAS
jgi:hypothetical protein